MRLLRNTLEFLMSEMPLINKIFKPYDIVTDEDGNVGFIQEVSISDCRNYASYAVNWLTGRNFKHAWFGYNELKRQGNLFVKIAEASCNAAGTSERDVKYILNFENDEK